MENSSNQSSLASSAGSDSMPLDIIMIGTFFYCMIAIIGVIGNILVISVLMIEKDLRNFTNYLLANLSISDLMVLLTCVPTGLHDLFAKERWYLGRVMCYLIGFIENSMGIASILSIFFITLERYYVICRPLSVKSLMTQSRTLKLIVFIWFLSIAINLPLIYMSEYTLARFNNDEVDYMCYVNMDSLNMDSLNSNWRQIYSIFVTFIIYLIIGIFLLIMYIRIAHHLKKSTMILATSSTIKNNNVVIEDDSFKHKRKLKLKRIGETLTRISKRNKNEITLQESNEADEGLINISSELERYIKPRKQLISMLMCVIIVFYVCLFPLKIWNMILMLFGHHKEFMEIFNLRRYWYINITVRCFFYANNSINPILYNWLSTKFRNGFKKLVTCKCKKEQEKEVYKIRSLSTRASKLETTNSVIKESCLAN